MNIVIAGGTGSGKTTLLNACSSFIPDNQRIVTIEDAPELRLQKPHVVRKTARRPNIEGEGEITIRQLVIHALRERPDRIVVGECRGGEAFDMIRAMMTGHEGSLTTVHSSNAREATTRLRSMIQQTGTEMRSEQIMELIASAIDFIVFVNRFDIDGSRKITEIAEVQGMQGDVITIGTIMRFEQTGFSEDGKVLGEFMPTGERITPAHREKLFARGVYVDDDFWFRKAGGNRLAEALRRVCQGAAPQLSVSEAAQLWAVIAFAPSVLILATGSAVGALATLPLGIAAFPIWVRLKRGTEQGLFEEQLGEAMPLIASNLRTGASVAQSVAPVAEHMAEPL